jgi:hypothetical protein
MPYGTINADLVVSATGGIMSPSSASGMKNRLINGAMVVNQRAFSGNITTGNEYTLDRFQGVCSVSNKFSVAQSSTAPAGFNNSLLVTSTSAYTVGAAEQFLIKQNIEAYNTNDLGWGTASAKTVTLSFQVYSSLTGTFGGALFNSNGSRSYPFTYTVSSANTWTSISITIAGDTSGTWAGTNGVGITVSWGLGVGSTYSGTAGSWAGTYYSSATGATSVVGTSSATFYITGVQLEVGSNATSFDYRPYGTELALCQRYYETNTGLIQYAWQSNASSPFRNVFMNFTVTKRTSSPSTALLSAVGGLTISAQNQFGFYAGVNIGNTTSDAYIQGYTCSAEL